MKFSEGHVARAVIASTWSYSTRVLGLGWTVLLIKELGIGSYGQYALGVAAAAITNAAIDNAFYVRSLRIDEDEYKRERCARVLFGTVIAAIGIAAYFEWYVAGFAIMVGAGELFFNTFKSQYMRAGRPDVAMRFEAIRQPVSIGLGAVYLLVAENPQLSVASALYVLPYGVIMLACLAYVPGQKPKRPGGWREITLLSSEAFAAAIYGQGDLLLLGLLADDVLTGYYSVALVTAAAVSTIGQNYASTFIERLRGANGDLAAAPPLSHIFRAGILTGAAMAAVGAGILIWGGADTVGVIFLIMSLYVFARAIEYNFVVILFVQRLDGLRVRATAVAAVVKVALLFPAIHLYSVYGAAAVGVLCELALIYVYYRRIYVSPRKTIAGTTDGALQP